MPETPEREQRFRRLIGGDVYNALWRYACRLARTREDAEDLLQDSLSRGYERLHQLRDDALAKGWMFSIMRRLHLDRVAAGGPETAELAEFRETDGTGNPDGLAAAVRQAVAALPVAQREAIELFHFEGLGIRETALALSVSENNVKQRLWRARQSLLDALGTSLRAGELSELF